MNCNTNIFVFERSRTRRKLPGHAKITAACLAGERMHGVSKLLALVIHTFRHVKLCKSHSKGGKEGATTNDRHSYLV